MARIDVYQDVTDRILEALAAGKMPWRRPWDPIAGGPTSLSTGRQYRGINSVLLSMAPYSSPFWGTIKEMNRRGGRVNSGEHGTRIVFWKFVEKRERGADGSETVVDTIPLLKMFTVFNVEQTTGVERIPEIEKREIDPIAEAEKIVAGYVDGPKIGHGGNRAFYAPLSDSVTLPPRDSFHSSEKYYGTMFHELIHSTGHVTRLDRDLSGTRGSKPYAKEELIAEIGASFLLNVCGIDPGTVLDNTAAYLHSWLGALQDDKRLVVQAAGAAEKAASRIAPPPEE